MSCSSCDCATELVLSRSLNQSHTFDILGGVPSALCKLSLTWDSDVEYTVQAAGPPWRTLFVETRDAAGVATFDAPAHSGPPVSTKQMCTM